MNVQLSPEFEQLLADEVAKGRFASARDVVEEGLRLLLEERRWRDGVRLQVAEGVAQARAGQFVEGDSVFDDLSRRLESRSS